jgi:glycosyltransferase involved in cell wall biosynthesis
MRKIQFHTIEQPDCEITAFILSCDRLDLLQQTINSFLATKDLPTKIVIVDDSGKEEIFDQLVSAYGSYADVICFPENRGLWWAKDFMVSFCSTKYIFYVEDDWLFLNTGYLVKSIKILEEHREIGSIDLSWRTFEEEGYDSYSPELIENEFYYKKPWQISPSHLHWFCWHGSPNLKRRDDLILLGRVEKYYTEWNIDRKFYSLGFRGVFLKDRYVTHLGDYRSVMAAKRLTENCTPETLYPEELNKTRLTMAFDYYAMDQYALKIRGNAPMYRNNDRAFVTCLLDINRESVDSRSFAYHYLDGLYKLIELNQPLIVFIDDRYYTQLLEKTGGKPVNLIPISLNNIRNREDFQQIKKICENPEWVEQAPWMRNSIIKSPDYIGLTLQKMKFLQDCVNRHVFKANTYYWIDSGICNSFNINSLADFNFNELPNNAFFMTKFPYAIENEMHGFNKTGFQNLCGQIPDFVCRATLFGGSSAAITNMSDKFNSFLRQALEAGYIGTEEAIFSGLALQSPNDFNLVSMPNGDIKNFLITLRG